MSEMNEYSDIEKTRLIHNKTVEKKKKKCIIQRQTKFLESLQNNKEVYIDEFKKMVNPYIVFCA